MTHGGLPLLRHGEPRGSSPLPASSRPVRVLLVCLALVAPRFGEAVFDRSTPMKEYDYGSVGAQGSWEPVERVVPNPSFADAIATERTVVLQQGAGSVSPVGSPAVPSGPVEAAETAAPPLMESAREVA